MVFSLSLSLGLHLTLTKRQRTPIPQKHAAIYPLLLSSDLAQIMPKIAFDVKHIRFVALCFDFIVNYLICYSKQKSLQWELKREMKNFPAYISRVFHEFC